MSIFSKYDYTRKKETIHKTKLPTQYKTPPKHKCSQCHNTDAKQYHITGNESRWLCIECKNKHDNGAKKENSVNFVKASRLSH